MEKPFELVSAYSPSGSQPMAIETLLSGLGCGLAHQVLLGVTGSGKTFTLANVIAQARRPAILLAPNKTLAAQLYGEMRAFFPNNAVEYFVSYYDYYQPEAYVPTTDTFIEKDASINSHIEQMRLSATKALLERKDAIIVASVSAIYGLGDPGLYLKMVLHIRRGDFFEQREILRRLTELQYSRNDAVFKRGQFRVRGEVIDIFPAESEKEAVRVEIFDGEIERLSLFDPLTGTLIQNDLPRFTIYPKTHYVSPKDRLAEAVEKIRKELKKRERYFFDNHRLLEAQRVRQRTRFDIEMIEELGFCSGIENYSRYLSGRGEGEPPPTLFDYLPRNGVLVIDESHVTVPQIRAMFKGDRARKKTLVEFGFRLPSALDNRPLKFEEFESLSPQTIFVSATPGLYELEKVSGKVVDQIIRPTGLLDPELEVRPAATQVDDLLSEITRRGEEHGRVLVTTLTKKMSEDLANYLSEYDIKVRFLHSDIDTVERTEIIRDFRRGKFYVLIGINLLREGLDMPEVSLVAILDADKEGFLRSEQSLIQIIGRAARNIRGKAILYADLITRSMKKAIEETNHRREKQKEYNRRNGVEPQALNRTIHDIMELGKLVEVQGRGNCKKPKRLEISSLVEEEGYQCHPTKAVPEKEVDKELKRLESQMYEYAENLDFERAAQKRDEIHQIQRGFFIKK